MTIGEVKESSGRSSGARVVYGKKKTAGNSSNFAYLFRILARYNKWGA